MQGQITLSKKEKHYQFLYLLLMLFAGIIFLGIIFLKGFESPFSDSDTLAVQNLEQKAKFDRQQKLVQPVLDSTFAKITRLTDEGGQSFEENEIMTKINDVENSFNNTDVSDIRRDAYPQIAHFYKMYFDDKKRISAETDNIKKFEKQFEDCSIGFKETKSQLMQRQNAIKSRTQ
jgi:hypothetical protein